ncbi:TetR family transcriptional regulator [Glutamicibacter soli]|uniref:TetR family transcriptional regulator n=1 Tax=Glutamicibacter soli TaxID=453836 RepID=A0A6L9G729_9MICC|nr:TetR/AcrR family transcriptional regulator [Glutamicibacter soli]NAZ16465.1 TetR family transcriptional regulator [Glutamicibacter soli]
MRSDALRRRKQILRTARELFATHGANVAMESIAEASDVGIGTLYRNFAARPELVEEVTLDMLQDVRQAAERAAAGLARGENQAWQEFLDALVGLNLGALSESLSLQLPQTIGERIMQPQRDTVRVVNQALELAKAADLVRQDLTGNELITGIGLATRPLPRAFAKAAPGIGNRLTRIMLDGMLPNPAMGNP